MIGINAVEIKELVNTFQIDDNVGIAETLTLLHCVFLCLRKTTCLTLFYNFGTHQCILHSKSFHFQRPSFTEFGWEAYKIINVSDRCPENFSYYRHLDLCYRIENSTNNNLADFDPKIKSKCSVLNSELVRIDSAEKQQYFKHALVGSPNLFVCVQGIVDSTNVWQYDDGTNMTYFNWAPGEPDGGAVKRLVLERDSLLWHDLPMSVLETCSFVCEIR